MDNQPTWGERVKTVRTRLGMTQYQLANELLIDRMTIALWEKRIKPPYSQHAERFVELEEEVLSFQVPEVVPEPEWEG
jgi:transcriptional regulator with XRE-family HTH domain